MRDRSARCPSFEEKSSNENISRRYFRIQWFFGAMFDIRTPNGSGRPAISFPVNNNEVFQLI